MVCKILEQMWFTFLVKPFFIIIIIVPSGPVTNIMVEVPSSDTLVLQWDLPAAEDQNGIIIGYVVEINATETGETFQLMTTLPTLMTNTLQPFTTYLCRIAARTMVGTGPYSIAVTAATLQDSKQMVIWHH